jgi:hypothetical protein
MRPGLRVGQAVVPAFRSAAPLPLYDVVCWILPTDGSEPQYQVRCRQTGRLHWVRETEIKAAFSAE